VGRLPDIVSLGKPSRFDLPSRQPWPLTEVFARYELLERLPSSSDDECYWARLRGPAGFERLVFLRRVPEHRFDTVIVDGIKQQAMVSMTGIAQVFELGRHAGWGFIVSEIVVGASIAALARSGQRISWLVALATVFDACGRLAGVFERYGTLVDLALSPARIILSTGGVITLCPGLPAAPPPPWHRIVCDIIHPILGLAADHDTERARLRALLTDDDPEAVWVACDALVERHPELDPVLPLVFLSLAGRVARDEAHAALVARVPVDELRALWHLVVDVAARRC
jgi:hypothetical protein